MPGSVAKIAVAAAKYWVDRPYDYLIPEELREKALPGSRVYVPFARGNRRSEGVILAISDHSDYGKLKSITAVLDDKPVLTPDQIKLALFMRERFFCTVFDAVKAMLPAGTSMTSTWDWISTRYSQGRAGLQVSVSVMSETTFLPKRQKGIS